MDLFSDLILEIVGEQTLHNLSLGLGIVAFVTAVALVFWLFRDARRRGTYTIIWGVLGTVAVVIGIFFGFNFNNWGFIAVGGASLVLVLIVLAAYTIMRPAEYSADAEERELSQRLLEAELDIHACPSCESGIEVDFLICPSCNVTLRRPCDYCSRPMKTAWSTCPYCLARKGQAETRAASAPVNLKGSGGGSPARKRPAPSDDDFADDDIDFGRPKSGGSGSGSGRPSGNRPSSPSRSRTSAGSRESGREGSREGGRRSNSGRTSTGSGRSSSGSGGAASSSSTFKD